MHILAELFVSFGGDGQGFLKDLVKAYLMAPMSPLNSPSLSCYRHFYVYASTQSIASWRVYF
jgi:hypothetical protein